MAFNPGTAAKAINAAVIAGGGATTSALLNGVISPSEIVTIVAVTLVAAATVYSTPNASTSDGVYAYGSHVDGEPALIDQPAA